MKMMRKWLLPGMFVGRRRQFVIKAIVPQTVENFVCTPPTAN